MIRGPEPAAKLATSTDPAEAARSNPRDTLARAVGVFNPSRPITVMAPRAIRSPPQPIVYNIQLGAGHSGSVRLLQLDGSQPFLSEAAIQVISDGDLGI